MSGMNNVSLITLSSPEFITQPQTMNEQSLKIQSLCDKHLGSGVGIQGLVGNMACS